jgi:hypothetical protein
LGLPTFTNALSATFSGICKPLNDLMHKDKPREWRQPQHKAFLQLKHAFATAPILAAYDHHKRTILETDASD